MALVDEILHGRKDNVEQLLKLGEDVDEIDVYGFTPLIEAAIANNFEIASLLIQHKAGINDPDMTGATALHWAVENNNIPLCKLLLERGANPNAYTSYAQSVLVKPLLRNHQELKKLLYQHGADLNFAQDYINTKLLGHRFSLIGRVDVVSSDNKFIELDFEGFILEFTMGIIQNSLSHFKNNFAARNLREYTSYFQTIIDALIDASELIRYQQYMIDIKEHKYRINELISKNLLVIPVGYEGHAISFIKFGSVLAKCDRGEKSRVGPSVVLYRIKNLRRFNDSFIKKLLYQKHNKEFINEEIIQILGLEPFTQLPVPSQVSGNCSWANIEAVIPTLFFMLLYQEGKKKNVIDIVGYKDLALSVYQQWMEWDQNWALNQCLETFAGASNARKASKAALLAAILFQMCQDHIPEDLAKANRILSILTLPDYKYVLDSYVRVYDKKNRTQAGKNLVDLLDVLGY